MVIITSMKTMGNQQVTSTTLAWLAGIWDGEGTFGIHRYPRVNGVTAYCGRLTLSNTSIPMIDEIVRILESIDVRVNIWKEKTSRKPNHKKALHLTVNRIDSVRKVSELLLPYLIAKKDRAELLIKFANSRSSYRRQVRRDPKTGYILGVMAQGYPEGDVKMFEEMRILNQVGLVIDGTSETTR